MSVRYKYLAASLVAVSSLTFSLNAGAAGFALIDQSASGMGNAFAGGSASAEDASTVFFNPAGMMQLENDQFVATAHFIMPQANFSNQGSSYDPDASGTLLVGKDQDGAQPALVPNFYYVRSLQNGMKFGVGVNVPFGLATKYNKDWVGRYHAVESHLQALNINPSIAKQFNDKLAVGFGLNVQRIDVKLSSAIDLTSLCEFAVCGGPYPDGFADLTGDSIGYGWNAGLTYEISPETRMGLAYRSKVSQDVDGNADFTIPSPLDAGLAPLFTDTGLKSSVDLPATLSASVQHRMSPSISLVADVTWTGWSNFQELRIDYDNPVQDDTVTTQAWEDSLRIAMGANYRLNNQWLLRTGFAYDESPIPDDEHRTARIPGNDRRWLAFGFSYEGANNITVDVGYTHLFISDATVNNTLEIEENSGLGVSTMDATLSGTFEDSADTISGQVVWKY